MTRFMPLEELEDAPVYDSLGLLYGRVCGFEYGGESLGVKVCIDVRVSRRVPDYDRLRDVLSSRGVDVEGLSLDELVVVARSARVDIPYRTLREDEKLVRSIVSAEEVAVVDRAAEHPLVLLSTPREAAARCGVDPREVGRECLSRFEVKRLDPGLLRGKHVVSLGQGYLGVVEGLALGSGGVALRVSRGSGFYVAWSWLDRVLRREGLVDIAERLEEELGDPLRQPRLPLEALRRLREALEPLGERASRLLREAVRAENVVTSYVPWSRVKYTNDVVVVE